MIKYTGFTEMSKEIEGWDRMFTAYPYILLITLSVFLLLIVLLIK